MHDCNASLNRAAAKPEGICLEFNFKKAVVEPGGSAPNAAEPFQSPQWGYEKLPLIVVLKGGKSPRGSCCPHPCSHRLQPSRCSQTQAVRTVSVAPLELSQEVHAMMFLLSNGGEIKSSTGAWLVRFTTVLLVKWLSSLLF